MSKEQDRLLTVKRVDEIMQKYKGLPIHKGFAAGLADCLIEQRDLAASLVRREIGEWLKNRRTGNWFAGAYHFRITKLELEALQQGKMPEE